MKIFMAPFLALVLLCPSCHSKWTTHTACKDDKLELLYQSCDPLQDFGFSVDHCNNPLSENLKIRFGIILRYNIKELFLDVNLFAMGKSVYSFSYPVCETDFPQFSFCGRRKGENIYYAGDINKPAFPIVKGEYHILLRLYNENNSTVVCANFTVLSY
ncbi:lymphocyte antigen 86 isoform X1 [Phascolarctos cinereus]|uniref:Lymphocyte antigen 86 n=1 Tax=Phascolarctos cinereus TaxID=38626 RepID=A0A6P5JEE8_PHACI|nr:lymphocyte antigen 86 [Phascolarctos cinereus]